MSQLQLLTVPPPALPEGIDLRCGDVADLTASTRGASLIHADPPWSYSQAPGVANPGAEGIYDVLSMKQIAAHVDGAYDSAAKGARLALWCTWPMLDKWWKAAASMRWQYMTGGSWHKLKSQGVGYHWLGRSEPVLVYVKPGTPHTDRGENLGNAHSSIRTDHSEKPIGWQRGMLRRWTRPGDLVLDLYAGLAPMARACALEGRRYAGAEIDPERHRQACDRLALWGHECSKT